MPTRSDLKFLRAVCLGIHFRFQSFLQAGTILGCAFILNTEAQSCMCCTPILSGVAPHRPTHARTAVGAKMLKKACFRFIESVANFNPAFGGNGLEVFRKEHIRDPPSTVWFAMGNVSDLR